MKNRSQLAMLKLEGANRPSEMIGGGPGRIREASTILRCNLFLKFCPTCTNLFPNGIQELRQVDRTEYKHLGGLQSQGQSTIKRLAPYLKHARYLCQTKGIAGHSRIHLLQAYLRSKWIAKL